MFKDFKKKGSEMRKVTVVKDQAGLEKNKIGLAAGFPGGLEIKSQPFNAGDVRFDPW